MENKAKWILAAVLAALAASGCLGGGGSGGGGGAASSGSVSGLSLPAQVPLVTPNN